MTRISEGTSLLEVQRYDVILFFDCEYTCWEDSVTTNWSDPARPPEVIQIAIASCDMESDKLIETFSTFVRPIMNPILSSYCKALLGLNQDTIDSASNFHTVSTDLALFLNKYQGQSVSTCTWGDERACVACNALLNNSKDPFSDLPSLDLMKISIQELDLGVELIEREDVRKYFDDVTSMHTHDALDDAKDLRHLLDQLIRHRRTAQYAAN